MLPPEARWLAAQFAAQDPEKIYPLCHAGSSTGEFREKDQPWIDREIFAPARRAGRTVIHADLKPAPGVDLVGDLSDPAFRASLRALGIQSLLCANLLEHVPEPGQIAHGLLDILPPGGWLFVTVPRAFPYHPDPIDTLFRPSPSELAALFPGTELIAGEVLNCGTLTGYTLRRLVSQPGAVVARIFSFLGPRSASLPAHTPLEASRTNVPPATWGSYFPWLFRTLQVTAIVLRKKLGP